MRSEGAVPNSGVATTRTEEICTAEHVECGSRGNCSLVNEIRDLGQPFATLSQFSVYPNTQNRAGGAKRWWILVTCEILHTRSFRCLWGGVACWIKRAGRCISHSILAVPEWYCRLSVANELCNSCLKLASVCTDTQPCCQVTEL